MTGRFETQLKAGGYRCTDQRRVVWEAVESLRHATPDQIAAHLPGVDLSTVYRALAGHVGGARLRPTHHGHGPPVYHAVDPTPHLHLVCQKCGKQASADISMADGLIEALQATHGFRADLDYMSLPGLCRECREADG